MAEPEDILAGIVLLEMFIDEDMVLLEEIEPKRNHKTWVRPWITERENPNQQNTQFKLQKELEAADDTKEFRTMLRMTPELYTAILERLYPRIRKKDTNFRNAISPAERLSLTLKFLAFGGEPADLAQQYRLGRCTVGRIIKETCGEMYEEFREEYLHTPITQDEWRAVADDFQNRWEYPGCLGSLDGKHIRFQKPPKSGTLYYNYKKYFSIVLMALVNSNYEFIFIDVGAEGRVADGGYWNASTLNEAIKEKRVNIPEKYQLPGTDKDISYHIVADDAFAMGETLLKPYASRLLSYREAIFNYRLSRARGIVENVFGILASRFRIFRKEIQMNPDSASIVVLGACTLHNILRRCIGKAYMNTSSLPRVDENEDPDHPHILDGLEPTHIRNPTRYAKQMRDDLSYYFISDEGKVAWQEGKIQQ